MNSRNLTNDSDRRSGSDRREFSYDAHIPEHRSGRDKREESDRRAPTDRRVEAERRVLNRQLSYQGPERRVLIIRRTVTDRRASIR